MPQRSTIFVWTTTIMMAIGLAALIVIVGVSWWLVERSEARFEQHLESRDMRAAAVSLRNALQDLEIGQRGFLLTGEESYLEPFERGSTQVIPAFERLERRLANYPQYALSLERLREGIDLKLEEMEETIALRRADRTEEATAIVQTDRGKALMDDARTMLQGIIAATDSSVVEGVEAQRANTTALRWVTIIGGIVIVLVAGSSIWIALRYVREIGAARAELEILNTALEERVEERTQDLIRANEEVQRFAYIVTHDLRAPLVNIMGFTSELDETMKTIQTYVLSDGEPLNEQDIKDARIAAAEDLPEAIGFIRSSTKKMDGLINAILKISRDGRRALKPETLSLEELLETTAASVHHQVAETDGEIRISVDVPSIVNDRLSIEQIFGNLLDNAVKYSADRPVEIDITARRIAGSRIRVDVADNGRGIAGDDHQRVFDLFRRAGSQDKTGEGIGLAHVRTLVRNLGGDITLASELGKGSTFSVILPTDIRTVTRST